MKSKILTIIEGRVQYKCRPYRIRSTSFDREILNPALAIASILSDNSMALNDLVLQRVRSELLTDAR